MLQWENTATYSSVVLILCSVPSILLSQGSSLDETFPSSWVLELSGEVLSSNQSYNFF